jgi:hypothetical protein
MMQTYLPLRWSVRLDVTLWSRTPAFGGNKKLGIHIKLGYTSSLELCVDACTSRHSRPRDHFGIAGCERAGGAARLGADLRVYACVSPAPPAAGPARGPWAASGPEKLRDSERSHGCRRDAVTVCFQYLVPQVTVSDDSTYCSELALLHSELGVAIRILPFELWPSSIKADGKETRQSSYNPNRV